VRERLLAAGVEIVSEVGLDTGLGRLNFEEAIKRAHVARATAYRQWSTKEAFGNAVLVELAKGLYLTSDFVAEVPAIIADMVGDGSALATPQGRRNLIVDLTRTLVKGDFESILQSPSWHLHTALSAASPSLTDPELRTSVTAALHVSDQRRIEARAQLYGQFTAFAGYRLRAPLAGPSGFRQMSEAAGAAFTGFLIRAQYDTTVTAETMRLRAFGMSEPRQWSPQTFASTNGIFSYIEPDPGIRWDQERISDLLLTDFTSLFRDPQL
jgi:hypothetical protein